MRGPRMIKLIGSSEILVDVSLHSQEFPPVCLCSTQKATGMTPQGNDDTLDSIGCSNFLVETSKHLKLSIETKRKCEMISKVLGKID